MILITTPVLLWCGVLAWTDFRERRLPNVLTLGAAAVALTARVGYGGWPLLVDGFAAAAVAGAFLLLPFFMRAAGGGDVKMLFAAGAIAGWGKLMMLLWVTSVAGVVMGVGMATFGQLDGARIRHYFRCIWDWRYDRATGGSQLPGRTDEKVRVPFSLPISVGLIFALLG